ncbi:MAG: nucleoside monophosphate kinase, partial [Sphingobacteriaceae bacterium]|nr:nucleoside monophosphate kinase [Sphingobacteriaceae bacterium]
IDKNKSAKGFVFDGFPRTVTQAEELDTFLRSKGSTVEGVIALDVTQEELSKRIAERQKVSGRADDAAEKLNKRIEEYFNKTIHVLPYYEAQKKLIKVNGIGEVETIFSNLCAVIDTLITSRV